MNKNIREVLVRVEYHGQIWFEVMNIESSNYEEKVKRKAETSDIRYCIRDSDIKLKWPKLQSNRESRKGRSVNGLESHGSVPVMGVLQEAF